MNVFIDWIFPKCCVGCKCIGFFLCKNCAKKISELSEGSDTQKFEFGKIIAYSNYTINPVLKKLIFTFKYKFSKEVVEILGEMLCSKLEKLKFRNCVLVPVPLHRKRFKFRGFNQSLVLAKYLFDRFDELELIDCLLRDEHVSVQAKLNRKDRMKNLKGIISVRKDFIDIICGRDVILIDDVLTTGSTLCECARALREVGVDKITGLVIAKV